MRVTALTTLFPDATQPTLGVFVEQSLLRLARVPGVELTLIAPLGVPPWPLSRHPRYRALAAIPRVEDWKGVRVERPRFPLIPGQGWRFNPALIARAALPLVRASRPDVIQGDFFFPCGVAAAAIGTRLRVPVSLKARGADIHHWGKVARGAVLGGGARAAGMLAVSGSIRDDMIAMGMDGGRIAVHYTGVDLERFAPVDREAARAAAGLPAPLVVSIGGLIPRKAHDVVIRAVAMLPGVHLRIAGRGPLGAMLEALIAELGVGDRLKMLGPLPHAEVARLMATADVLALASISEGLANVAVEALACGTPVVATPVDGTPELMDRPAAGRMAERTPEAFAAAIGAVLAGPPSQSEARAVVQSRFAWDRHVAELHAHLARLAGAGPVV